MYDKLFREHKLVAIYSFSIIFILLVAVFISGSRNTLNSNANQRDSDILRGCFYRLNCPPNSAGNNPRFRCNPTLVCPTPSSLLLPTSTTPVRTSLTCGECLANNASSLCLDSTRKTSFCTNSATNIPGRSCITCSTTPTRAPSVTPFSSRISPFPTRHITITRTPTPVIFQDNFLSPTGF